MATIATSWRSSAATTGRGFARSHELAAYFVLAFALSWGAMLIAVAPSPPRAA